MAHLLEEEEETASSVHTTLRVVCGCGERFPTISQGENHSLQKGHTLDVFGIIRNENKHRFGRSRDSRPKLKVTT